MKRRKGFSYFCLLTLLGGLSILCGQIAAEPAPVKGWLGVTAKDLPFPRLEVLQLQYGIEVTRVIPGGPAARAGLQEGDILIELDGKPVYSVRRLEWLVASLPVRNELSIKYRRGDRIQTASVQLQPVAPISPPLPFGDWRVPSSYLGVGLQVLTDDLRQAFGVPQRTGVLVTQVFAGSPAEQAGLVAGDVITKMDRKTIARIADVTRVLDFFDPGDRITVELIRDRETKAVSVELAAPPQSEPKPWPRGWYPPTEIPAPYLEPRYWQHQLDELIKRWREFWQEPSPAWPDEWPRSL